MTLNEFLERLRGTPRDWFLDMGAWIRRRHKDGSNQCPITAVGNKPTVCHVYSIGAELGLLPSVISDIASAADCNSDTKLRRQLLEACGLAGEAP